MLKNTLILPESDARLASTMLQEAIDRLDVILMLIFGKGEDVLRIVEWADQLCEKTRISETATVRRIVWIRNIQPLSIQAVLDSLIDVAAPPRVAVLNFHDQLRGTLAVGETARPLQLERLFLKGGETVSDGAEVAPADAVG